MHTYHNQGGSLHLLEYYICHLKLALETDLFARPGGVDPHYLQ
jgi:hypothetical protein